MLALPDAAKRGLFGEPPHNDEGAPLDLDVHVLLRLMETTGQPDLHTLGVDEARELYADSFDVLDLEPREISIADFNANEVGVRVYRPRAGVLPCLVYYHGGGFTVGRARDYDRIAAHLACELDVVVASVDYRLAPESPFPAAVDDSVAAFNWIVDNQDLLDIDGAIGVAGDSAGGNLATVVCVEQIRAGLTLPRMQALIYPTTDSTRLYDSYDHFSEGYFLTEATRKWFFDNYASGADRHDPRISPLLFDRLDQMPDTLVVTAGFDPLRDQGRAYAQRLRDEGVQVVERCEDTLVHSYVTMAGAIPAARRAVDDLVALMSDFY